MAAWTVDIIPFESCEPEVFQGCAHNPHYGSYWVDSLPSNGSQIEFHHSKRTFLQSLCQTNQANHFLRCVRFAERHFLLAVNTGEVGSQCSTPALAIAPGITGWYFLVAITFKIDPVIRADVWKRKKIRPESTGWSISSFSWDETPFNLCIFKKKFLHLFIA